MHVIHARNVTGAYYAALEFIRNNGMLEESRNGKVLVAPTPVITRIDNPWQRVLFADNRGANPFFHFMESLWMLAGRNDVQFVKFFVKRMEDFSDNSKTLHGAYGYRWRKHFQEDQLINVIRTLRHDPTSRRVVLTMWDPRVDNGVMGLDKPCNTHIYFRVVDNKLDMTVCNRSNDIIWGLYGANAVHMSVMHEFAASALGREQGVYYTLSNNFHMYVDHYNPDDLYTEDWTDPYYQNYDIVQPHPLMFGDDASGNLNAIQQFCQDPLTFESSYAWHNSIAKPMYLTYKLYKDGHIKAALEVAKSINAIDWQSACVEWLKEKTE